MHFKWMLLTTVFLTITLGSASQIQIKPVLKNNLTVQTSAPFVPVLKRLDANPLLVIKIYKPASVNVQSLQAIHYTLNDAGAKAIEKLELFNTGYEAAFAAKNSIGKFDPISGKGTINVKLALRTGWNYLWVSAVLKETASMDANINFHVTAVLNNYNAYKVTDEHGKYEKYIGTAIRKAWDDSVHTYRIPGLATTNKGTLLGVYDIRYKHSGDLPANVDVGLSRSTDGGLTWEPMKIIMDMGAPQENNGVGDPAILFDPKTNTIWVAALWSKGNRSIAGSEPGLSPDTTGQFVLVHSKDDGITWSEPVSITTQIKDPKWHLYFNGPGSGIAMQDGKLVFASQYWDESKKPGIPHSSIIYSDDHGKTWKSGTGARYNTTEAQVVETTPGTLMLNMRDNRGGYRSVSTTTDMGKTWTDHPTSFNTLEDPVCMASIIKANVIVKGKKQEVLFYSNVNSKYARVDMTIKASLDLGETWLPAHEILLDERSSYGYSSLTMVDEYTIGILYEGSRDLFFVKIPVKDIVK